VVELTNLNKRLAQESANAAKDAQAKEASFKTRFAAKNAELEQMAKELDLARRDAQRSNATTESRLKAQLHNVNLRLADVQKELTTLKKKNDALAEERDRLRVMANGSAH
jgi:chromosome segregation ATPase